MREHIERERARRDIIESYTYLHEDNPSVAERFLTAIESTFLEITEMPQVGARRFPEKPGLAQMRAYRIRGFPNWLVFYLVNGDQIDVVRVLHGARDLDHLLADEA